MKGIFIVGDGGWGTALAQVLSTPGTEVILWSHDPKHSEALASQRENRLFLPGVPLKDSINFTSDFAGINESDYVVTVVPSKFLTPVLERMAQEFRGSAPIVSCTKGITPETLKRPSEMIREVFPHTRVAVLSGPSHAEEVARFLPATVVCASDDAQLALSVQTDFTRPTLRIYTGDDMLGVELAAALKNVIAIAAGICDGLQLGDNAKSALMVRGLAEMIRFATRMGAQRHTLEGLSGIGDLITTCISRHGRNRAVGEAIARGQTIDQITSGTQMVAEGVLTTRSIKSMADRLGIDMPITTEIHHVLFEGKPPQTAVADLMSRRSKAEHE